MDQLDAGLAKLVAGIRRARAGYEEADEGFIEVLAALKDVSQGGRSLTEQIGDLRDTVVQLQTLVLEQSREIRELRDKP